MSVGLGQKSAMLLFCIMCISACSSSGESNPAEQDNAASTENSDTLNEPLDAAGNTLIQTTVDESTPSTTDAIDTNPINLNPGATDSIAVDVEITVPRYVSNELQVKVSWGSQELTASWVADESWLASGEFAADESHLLTVSFSDRNGGIILGRASRVYSPVVNDDITFDLVSISANEFDTDRWDDDADGISNMEELKNGTDPLLAQSLSSEAAFDLSAAAPSLTQSLAGFQLDKFSSAVDELAFIVAQQTKINFPNDDYHQVQHAYRFTNICDGEPTCTVVPGSYLVINLNTDERELIDIPYIAPAELPNAIALPDVTLALNGQGFDTDSVSMKKWQYQCEQGGSVTTGYVDQRIDVEQVRARNIRHRDFVFDQCKVSVKDSFIPDGNYVVHGAMSETFRNYGFFEYRTNYVYDNFSLIEENGLEYRIDGETESSGDSYVNAIYNRSATISEYIKTSNTGQIEESIRNSQYRSALDASTTHSQYEMEMNGMLRSQTSAGQWVTVTTNSPLLQEWYLPDDTLSHQSIPFQGSFQMQSEDGSLLTANANSCFINADGDDCLNSPAKYIDHDYLTASGSRIQLIGEKYTLTQMDGPNCESGTLRRTYINPGKPYVNAKDEGRLECTQRDQWHTDLYDRYTFGPVILPEREITIP